jgi:phage terminase small subunit
MTQSAKNRLPRAPTYLRKPTAAWWKRVVRDYELAEHHVLLLTKAAEQLDRGEEARERITLDGSYQHDRYGVLREHPAVKVEHAAMIAFARLLRELDLDGEPLPASRPPLLGRNRYASQT